MSLPTPHFPTGIPDCSSAGLGRILTQIVNTAR